MVRRPRAASSRRTSLLPEPIPPVISQRPSEELTVADGSLPVMTVAVPAPWEFRLHRIVTIGQFIVLILAVIIDLLASEGRPNGNSLLAMAVASGKRCAGFCCIARRMIPSSAAGRPGRTLRGVGNLPSRIAFNTLTGCS